MNMKKFLCMVAVLVLTFAVMTSAMAASYKDGKVTYSVGGSGDVEVWFQGEILNIVSAPATATSAIGELAPGKYTLNFSNGESDSFTVGAEATEEPTPTPVVTPTPTPVVPDDPTPTPVTSMEPSQDPTKEPTDPTKEPSDPTKAPTAKPTKAPATSDDDVPKTGDATTTFLFVIVAMMVLAAGALTAMRVASRRK